MTTATTERISPLNLESEHIPPIGLPEAADVPWERRLNAELAWQLAHASVDEGTGQRAGEGERRPPTMRSITRMNTILVALRERLYQIQTESANIAIGELALRQEKTPGASPDDAFSPLHEDNVKRLEALVASCLGLLGSARTSLTAVVGTAEGRYSAAPARVERRRQDVLIDFPDRRRAAA